ncbi:MAG TPA: hypothetical protein VG604_04645 [Candidatus Saccharimonadales bacterium]|nr:hypothetical protein [Candidatus Saccharimonadales bacterium]
MFNYLSTREKHAVAGVALSLPLIAGAAVGAIVGNDRQQNTSQTESGEIITSTRSGALYGLGIIALAEISFLGAYHDLKDVDIPAALGSNSH